MGGGKDGNRSRRERDEGEGRVKEGEGGEGGGRREKIREEKRSMRED